MTFQTKWSQICTYLLMTQRFLGGFQPKEDEEILQKDINEMYKWDVKMGWQVCKKVDQEQRMWKQKLQDEWYYTEECKAGKRYWINSRWPAKVLGPYVWENKEGQ